MATKKTVRFMTNPFVKDMDITIKGRPIRLSTTAGSSVALLNTDTGEIQGTHVMSYKKVDDAQFIKLFAANVAMTFDLTSAGIKAFTILNWSVQQRMMKDQVDLDSYALEEFKEKYGKSIGLTTFKRGLTELEDAFIIAKTRRAGRYFINPNFIFNGDRVAFSTVFERDDSKDVASLEE